MTLRRRELLSFAYICIFPSLLGYLFLNRGIELIGANRAAPFMHLVPVFGSVLAIVLLGERFEVFMRSVMRWCLPGSRSRRGSQKAGGNRAPHVSNRKIGRPPSAAHMDRRHHEPDTQATA